MNWELICRLAYGALTMWTMAALVRSHYRGLNRPAPRVAQWIAIEGRPLVPVVNVAASVSGFLADGGENVEVWVGGFALVLTGWWLFSRDQDDDDRWKRRREALTSKVAEVGGRLQVVPAGGAS